MGRRLSEEQWQRIAAQLETRGDAHYGLPDRRTETLVLASWNLVAFGAETVASSGEPRRSPGAYELIANFCSRCDLISIQEVLSDMWSVRHLRDRANQRRPGAQVRLVASDLTGKEPKESGGKFERFAFLFDETRIQMGEIASDLTIDRPEVTRNVNAALEVYREELRQIEHGDGLQAALMAWIEGINPFQHNRLPSFFQFARSPHLVTFRVEGRDGAAYDFAAVNAHVTYDGHDRNQRKLEFFALLEWLLARQGLVETPDTPMTLLLGDLNLDFDSDNDQRRRAVADTVARLNAGGSGRRPRAFFPFLEVHPDQAGPFLTNSRQDQTFDHIAFFTDDDRFPRSGHSRFAGQNGFDFGMFDFQRLVADALPELTADGKLDTGAFKNDISDHMPIWIRLPMPAADQFRYPVADV